MWLAELHHHEIQRPVEPMISSIIGITQRACSQPQQPMSQNTDVVFGGMSKPQGTCGLQIHVINPPALLAPCTHELLLPAADDIGLLLQQGRAAMARRL